MGSTERTPEATRDPWVWVAFLLPAAAVLFSLMQTEDLAYQVRAGELMWRLHDVLRTDPFTFTMAGAPWHNQQWGAQLLLAGIHGVGGWRGLVVARAGIVGGAVGVTYLRTKARGAQPMTAVLVTFVPFLVCLTMPGAQAMRPQLLVVPLFLIAAVVLSQRRARPRALWAIPIVGIFWANLHGSFVLLPLLCAVAFVADLVDRDERRLVTGGARRDLRAGTGRDALGPQLLRVCLPALDVDRRTHGDRRVATDLAAAPRRSPLRGHLRRHRRRDRAREPSRASRGGLAHARTLHGARRPQRAQPDLVVARRPTRARCIARIAGLIDLDAHLDADRPDRPGSHPRARPRATPP